MLEKIELIAQNAIRIENKNGKVIYFDPFKLGEKYTKDADYIFVTHSHFDHFSPEDISKIKKDDTKIVAPGDLKYEIEKVGFDEKNVILVKPNDEYKIDEIDFSTIPAYNKIKNFHKREYNWVGYIVNIDEENVYIAGDTDNTDEARNVKCDIACIPIGGTYTMNYEEAAELINVIKPKLAIPTHYKTIVGTEEDAQKFKELIDKNIEAKILMN